MNINRVVLTGNLTRDPELRHVGSGNTVVCELGVATNEREKVNGEWEDRPNFFTVTVWGNQAESCAQYLSKGRPVAIDGRLRYESWEKDGEKKSVVKIVANMVQFLHTKSDSEAGGDSFEPASAPSGETSGGGDDDIPFARPEYEPLFSERARLSNRP